MVRWTVLVALLLMVLFPLSVLAEPVIITGTVVDPAGNPVEGARVGAVYPPPDGVRSALAETTTGADGSFSLQFEARGLHDMWTVAAWADGHMFAAQLIELTGEVQVHLALGADPGSVRGCVVDAAGRPVASAKVWLRSLALATPDGQQSTGYNKALMTQVTDDDGSFTLSGLPRGAVVSAGISATGFARRQAKMGVAGDPTTPVTIMLQPESVITGHVRRDGEPMADVRVWARPTPPNGLESDQTVTGPDGSYRLDRLPAGGHELRAYPGEGLVGRWRSIEVAVGEAAEDVDLEAIAGGTVEGTVTLADTGKPAVGAIVSANDTQGVALVGEDGSYSMVVLPGSYALDTYPRGAAEGYSVAEPRIRRVTVTGGETISGMDFAMLPRATFSGTILDPDGEPVEGALV